MRKTASVTPAFPPPLKPHQIPVSNFVATHPRCGIFLDIGGGKTLTILATLFQTKPQGHILIIAPLAIAKNTWIGEIEKWHVPVQYKSLVEVPGRKTFLKKDRERLLEEVLTDSPTMYFINQESIVSAVDYYAERNIPWPFPNIIIDESQEFKSHSSQRFKALKKILPETRTMILMTGTPISNSLLDLWSQMYLIDGGQSLGTSFTKFRAEFFTSKATVNNVPIKWEINPGAEDEIYRRVAPFVMSAKNNSVMPNKSIKDVFIPIPSEAKGTLRTLSQESIVHFLPPDYEGDPDNIPPEMLHLIVASNKAILVNKFRQMASGTSYTVDADGNSTGYTVIHNAKLDALCSFVVNTPETKLIAYEFTADRERILTALRSHGVDAEAFDGSRHMLRRWNEGQIPALLIHPASAGHGINFQEGGHILIWYTLPFSLQRYQQTNGRLFRTGQPHDVTIYRMIATGTYDEKIPAKLVQKHRRQKSLLDAVARDEFDEYIA